MADDDSDVMDLRSSIHNDPIIQQFVHSLDASSLVSVDDSAAFCDDSSGSVAAWAGLMDVESLRPRSDDERPDEGEVDRSEETRSMMGWSVVSAQSSSVSLRPGVGGEVAAAHTVISSAYSKATVPTSNTKEEAEKRKLRRQLQLKRCIRSIMIVAALAAFSGCVVYILEFYVFPGTFLDRLFGTNGEESRYDRRLPEETPEGLPTETLRDDGIADPERLTELRRQRANERWQRRAERAEVMADKRKQRRRWRWAQRRRAVVWEEEGLYVPHHLADNVVFGE